MTDSVESTPEKTVKAKWPDAELSRAFAVQPDKSRRWMWCVMSSLKFVASRGKRKRVANVGSWRFSEAEAWADAAEHLSQHEFDLGTVAGRKSVEYPQSRRMKNEQ